MRHIRTVIEATLAIFVLAILLTLENVYGGHFGY